METPVESPSPSVLGKLCGLIPSSTGAESSLASPQYLRSILPLDSACAETISLARQALCGIVARRTRKLIAVVGPCSIHDAQAALEYARRLKKVAARTQQELFIVMRCYLEKPRTTIGWKGLVNDPYLDGSCRIQDGIIIARRLLREIATLGLPAAAEVLDPSLVPYLGDLISWTSIGARTCESQIHRELASGLATPVGIKNATDGRVEPAVDAIRAACRGHSRLSTSERGECIISRTPGNAYCHVVLRGGMTPNYDADSIRRCEQLLAAAELAPAIMVDCSHGNSGKIAANQPAVLRNVLRQISTGNRSIIGFMLESNLEAGRQDLPLGSTELRWGVSVTDDCIDWSLTEQLLLEAADTWRELGNSHETDSR